MKDKVEQNSRGEIYKTSAYFKVVYKDSFQARVKTRKELAEHKRTRGIEQKGMVEMQTNQTSVSK